MLSFDRNYLAKIPGARQFGTLFARYAAARMRRADHPTPNQTMLMGRDQLAEIFRAIGIDKDYSTMDFRGIVEDVQGWESRHKVFEAVFRDVRPNVVVEVGTWKGASVLHMDSLSQTLGCGTSFVCVDTWLGSNDALWIDTDFRKSLMLQHGFPTMFRQFIYNITRTDAADRIFPLPMTSTCGAYLLKRLGLVADAIYIDAGHEEDEVATDLVLYYDILRPGGVMFGDDYSSDWPGLVRAVDAFCRDRGLVLTSGAGKWRFQRPPED